MPDSVYLDLLHADSRLYPDLFKTDAAKWFEQLRCELDWQTESVQLFGKKHLAPRLTSFYGDPGIRYAYSGIVQHARSWQPLLSDIRNRLEQLLELSFNSVLANYYRDGNDHMGWHSDNEPELRSKPHIASISFGAQRSFYLRHKEHVYAPYHLSLPAGSALLMGRSTQQQWQHCLPRRLRVKAPRINLTFRCIAR